MSRGRPPSRGIHDALPLARARGLVMEVRQNGETPAELVISENGKVIFVRIRRAEPFRRTPADLEAEYRGPIAQIRSIPGNGNILREFWAYSKCGTWRFFRVKDDGLAETGRDGLPLASREMRSLPVHGNPGKTMTVPADITPDPERMIQSSQGGTSQSSITPSPMESTPILGIGESGPLKGSDCPNRRDEQDKFAKSQV